MARERLSGEERREQIAAAALRLVASEGGAALTAARIAAEIGVSDAALFRHYPSLEAIVDAAIERFARLVAASLRQEAADPVERLGGFFVHRLALLREHPEILQLAFNDRLADAAGEQGAARVRETVAASRRFVLRTLGEAQEAGLVRRDLPCEMLAWTLFGFMRGAGLSPAGRASAPSPDAIWASLGLLLCTARPPAPPARRRRSRPAP